jgi:hypothetical protein
MQHSQGLGNHARKIAHKLIANPIDLSGIYHQCTVLHRLWAKREVGPGTRWKIAFHRSGRKVYRTIVQRRFTIFKSGLESERLDANWW